MPSKGRAEWNAEYYAKNCDDILYRKKQERKNEKVIECKCGIHARYKDNSSARGAHFRTQGHRVWEMKKDICILLTGSAGHTQQKAEYMIEKKLQDKNAISTKEKLAALMNYKMNCIDSIDNHKKPKKPKPIDEVVEEERQTTPPNLYGSTQKEYVPPSADFDVMSLMGTSNSDMEGI